MSIHKILNQAMNQDIEIDSLKEMSPLYPAILLKAFPWKGVTVASTIVKVERDDKSENVHCLKRTLTSSGCIEPLLYQINREAENILNFYIISKEHE